MNGLGPELPLQRDHKYGNYALITNYVQQVKQNFKNLLLTIPGERVMDPDFGIGLKRYLFENREDIEPRIRQRVEAQVNKYMPFIRVNSVLFDTGLPEGHYFEDSHVLSVTILYEVPDLNLSTKITLQTEEI